MNETNERSGASAGSQPMAWAVMQPDSYSVFASRILAGKMQKLCAGGEIVPLYRQPQPALTDAEREAIYRASRYISQNDAFEGMAVDADTLDALLERTK